MNGLNWIALAIIVALVAYVIYLRQQCRMYSDMALARTIDYAESYERAQEHTAIPYSRFLHPPSQPLISGRPARHSAPISMPLNKTPDDWSDFEWMS